MHVIATLKYARQHLVGKTHQLGAWNSPVRKTVVRYELVMKPTENNRPIETNRGFSVHHLLDQGFSTSGSRPHLGSPSDFRGVARLSANFLKNDGIFKY